MSPEKRAKRFQDGIQNAFRKALEAIFRVKSTERIQLFKKIA